MYIAAGLTAVVCLVLLVVSRKEKTKQAGVLKPFYKMATFLYRHMNVGKLSLFADKQVEKDLLRLHPEENREEVCAEYYVKKIALSLCICVAASFLGVIISTNAKKAQVLEGTDGTGGVKRGSYLEEPREIMVQALGEEHLFHVTVEEQKLTKEEAENIYQTFWEELQQEILGENLSLGEVRNDLKLVDALEGYPFLVEWESEMPDLLNSYGEIQDIDMQETVLLKVFVTYEDMEWQEEIEACLMPELLSAEELKSKELQEMLDLSEKESREEPIWKLPETYQGTKLIWKQVIKDDSLLLWAGMLLLAVLVYFLSDKDLHNTLEKRKEQMKREYPEIVQKLVLYMGAGMTIRRAFQKIAGDYEQGKMQGGRSLPIYEEMLYACRELQTGISEGAAYEHFGKRTGLQEYIRLCTLLQQNLKKGTSTLLSRLREEADKAVAEKVQGSRRHGEEAATKLLLPMVMMLLVVMIIIMIPAFSSTIT